VDGAYSTNLPMGEKKYPRVTRASNQAADHVQGGQPAECQQTRQSQLLYKGIADVESSRARLLF
jgi:hypothetical protein